MFNRISLNNSAASLLMTLILLIPFGIKADHHHHHEQHHDCGTGEENSLQYENTQEICFICDFTYPIFSKEFPTLTISKSGIIESLYQSCTCHCKKLPAEYSFLLRAPPCGTN